MHELVIIETGHIDTRFKHEVWNVLRVYSTLFRNEFRREKDKESCGIIYTDVRLGKQGENRSQTFNSKFLYVLSN